MKLGRLIFCVIAVCLTGVANAATLEDILQKKYIEFAVYEKYPPFSFKDEKGKTVGVDVDIAKLIANELGVKAGIRTVMADESVDDDLRNFVWKGHFTAGGASDVMLHIPYDPNFARNNEKVAFIQPYYRELVAFAVNTYRIRNAMTLEIFRQEPIGVESDSLADAYLLGAYSGGLRDSVRRYPNVDNAVKAMVDDKVTAVMATRSELEFSLGKYEHEFIVTKLPTPGLMTDGWSLSPAVKADNVKLAQKLNEIVGKLKDTGKIEEVFEKYGLHYNEAVEKDIITPVDAKYAVQ